MRKNQKFKSGGGLQVLQKILNLLLFFLNCQKGMTTFIYQCENYLISPLDPPLYIPKKNQVNRWRNEGNLVFFHLEKSI